MTPKAISRRKLFRTKEKNPPFSGKQKPLWPDQGNLQDPLPETGFFELHHNIDNPTGSFLLLE